MLNSVHCVDKLVGEFVGNILSSEHSDNTLIVLASDHLAMNNAKSIERLKKGQRKNLFMIIDAGKNKPKKVKKPGNTVDIAPTVLSKIGFEVEALGFGRNLLSNAPTLAEASLDADKFLREQSEFLNNIWGFPDLKKGFAVDQKTKKVKLGDREAQYPAIFMFDKNLKTTNAVFANSGNKGLPHFISKNVAPKQAFAWVDECQKVLSIKGRNVRNGEACIAIGYLGAKNIFLRRANKKTRFSPNKIKQIIEEQQDSVESSVAEKRCKILKEFAETGTISNRSDLTGHVGRNEGSRRVAG